ncbi:MAG: hypothetical protein E7324_00075 [Clostridiales bacterium]|nr:hypothetical protein [Clostridiales bacterium]
MKQKREEIVALYVITGFLESGKTSLIENMLRNERFTYGQRTMILSCEEGEVELDAELLKKSNSFLVQLQEPEELTAQRLSDLSSQNRLDRVIVEYNSVWGIELLANTPLPPAWRIVQVVNLADATTFDNYMANMRKFLTDPMKESEMILVNRCAPQHNKSAWRRQIKAINPRANVLFENLDGSMEDGVADEDLPYDVKAPVIDIREEHMGTFYLDSLEHPDRYDGKTVRLTGQYFKEKGLPKGFMIFGRMAMTCCADDIAPVGWVCRFKKPYAPGAFVELTALCHMVGKDLDVEIMLDEMDSCPGQTPKEKFMIFE